MNICLLIFSLFLLANPLYAQTPVIEAGDITASGSNAGDATPDVSFPAYVSGDLLIQFLGRDDDVTNHTTGTPANGPNGETLIVDSTGGGGNAAAGPSQGVIAWVGDATVGASTLAWTISAGGEQWEGRTIKVLAGEFDSVTPIGTLSGYSGNTSDTGTTIPTPAFTAGATDGNGKIVVFLTGDTLPITGTVTGWTLLANVDGGATSAAVALRDAAATDSESIASVDYTIGMDSSSTIALIVREPTAAGFSNPLTGPLGGPLKRPIQ